MIRMLVRVPIMVVVMEGSEETTAPCRFQEMVRGSSPFTMEQVIWTYEPSSTTSEGKEKGPIWGGSGWKNDKQRAYFQQKQTIKLFRSAFLGP